MSRLQWLSSSKLKKGTFFCDFLHEFKMKTYFIAIRWNTCIFDLDRITVSWYVDVVSSLWHKLRILDLETFRSLYIWKRSLDSSEIKKTYVLNFQMWIRTNKFNTSNRLKSTKSALGRRHQNVQILSIFWTPENKDNCRLLTFKI